MKNTDVTRVARRAPADDGTALLGRVLADRYTLTGVLGHGGMGVVYRGVEVGTGRAVAIKVLHTSHAAYPDASKRFEREGKLTCKLQHPNTIRVFDSGSTDDGLLYLVMELLEGRVLADELDKHGRISTARTTTIATQILKALHEAHGLGIVHRDLKPENVFLQRVPGEPDFVKVMDFGIAKLLGPEDGAALTQVGQTSGTPSHMSPEQARGWPVDGRTDLYSLGVILFQMLTGELPFNAPNVEEMLHAHVSKVPARVSALRPELKGHPLDAAVWMLMSKNADDRPAHAMEALALLSTPGIAPLPRDGGFDPRLMETTVEEEPVVVPRKKPKPDVTGFGDAETHVESPSEQPTLALPMPPATELAHVPTTSPVTRVRARSYVLPLSLLVLLLAGVLLATW